MFYTNFKIILSAENKIISQDETSCQLNASYNNFSSHITAGSHFPWQMSFDIFMLGTVFKIKKYDAVIYVVILQP